MTNKKTTKRALLFSLLSMLLCVTMLMGTTFAWFTDSVSSVNNIIKSGNLDVELEYYNGSAWVAVDEDTNVFSEELWEPGHTEVVYLKVSNLGTLALKYNLGVNIAKETEGTNVYGDAFKLSDYIYYDAFEVNGETDAFADRAAAMKDTTETIKISNSYTKVNSLLTKEANYVALVVYMPETVGNEANYKTGTVAPQIDLGINLFATQYTYEEDSFDNRYDGEAFIPVADVDTLGAQTVTLVDDSTMDLDTSFSFKTTEDKTAAAASGYRYWHADFVVSVDKTVKANSMALAGYYEAYAEATNTVGKWIALQSDEDIAAGTEIRLMELMGVSGNYEELCNWIPEFLCGAADLSNGGNGGTTLTVELRLYETTIYSGATSGSANVETGKYITIGKYSYTFPSVKVTNDTELKEAIENGVTSIDLADGTYHLPDAAKGKTLTISGSKNAVIEHVNQGEDGMNYSLEGSAVTFNGVTIKTTSGTYRGFARSTAIVYNNCNFVGTYTLGAGSHTFNDCHFNLKNNYVWTWGGVKVVFDGCTFEDENGVGKAILVHNTVATEVTVKDCTFIATTGAKTWDGIDVAAVSIDPNGANTAKVTFEGTNTVDSAFNGKYQIKYAEDNALVTIVE